jgi:hypothetical protein
MPSETRVSTFAGRSRTRDGGRQSAISGSDLEEGRVGSKKGRHEADLAIDRPVERVGICLLRQLRVQRYAAKELVVDRSVEREPFVTRSRAEPVCELLLDLIMIP